MAMSADSLAAWLPILLQANDTLFPTGGYAHSFGFEEFARARGLKTEGDLREFVETSILPALEHQELPYLRFAFEAVGDLGAICAIDREISAWKIARELRDASTQIGGRRLAALRAVNDRTLYRDFAGAIAARQTPGHHLTVCALQAAGESFPLPAALAAYVYQAVSGVCSASLKLLRIGQEGCQRVLRRALEAAPEVVARSQAVERDRAGFFDPLLEIAAMRHEFANERLFIS